MRKKCLFLTILLLGFQLVFIGSSWPTELDDHNKRLASALRDLQWTIIEKIEYEADTTATAFADAENIDRDLRLKDIFRTPLVIIEETINTIGSLVNARRLAENAQQVLDSSETNLQIVSGIMTLSTLKQVGENLQLAIDGPSYCSTIEEMLDKAYRRSSTRLWFKPEAYKTVIKNYLYAQYEPGPLRIPHKSTNLTRRNLEIASGTYEIQRNIKERFRTLRDKLEDNPLSPDSALEALNQIKKIKEVIEASKGSNQELSYETYLKNESGNYIPTTVDLRLGSIAELEKVRQIALANSDKEMKIEQVTTISKAVRAGIQATALHIRTTYKSPKTGEILGELQKWSLVPLTIEVGLFRPFDTSAREQVNLIPQEMMMTLPLELSNVWIVADDTASYIEYLIKTEKEQPPKPTPPERGIPAEIRLTDKSTIKGEILEEKIKIKTKYGEMDIPVENFVSIIGQLIELKDGTTLKGNFAEKTLSVKTDYGKFKVETKDIDFITFAKEEKPPTKEPVLPSEEKIPIPEYHGVYLVAKGRLIEIKDRFLEVGGIELKTLSGINILDPNAYIIFYRDYPPTAHRKVALIELRYNDSSGAWELGSKEIELKTAPLKGKMIAYKLIPTVSLSPGAYSLLLVRSVGLFPDLEMFDFTVNCQKSKEYVKFQAHKHYKLGMSYSAHEERLDDAIKEFKKAMEIQPNHSKAQFMIGWCYFNKEMYNEAIVNLERAIQIDPSDPEAHRFLGFCHFNIGRGYYSKRMCDEAIGHLKKAIEINPDHSYPHYLLGHCYYEKKIYGKAIAMISRYLELLKEKQIDERRQKEAEEFLQKLKAEKSQEVNPN